MCSTAAARVLDRDVDERFVHVIAHEYIHSQQAPALANTEDLTVLQRSLLEGIADGRINPFGPSSAEGKALLDSIQVNDEVRHARGTMDSLDFKVSRTFKVSRFTILPTFEVFNVNNSDAIISYISTNTLSSSFLAPNSIMQGRMFGFGVVARW